MKRSTKSLCGAAVACLLIGALTPGAMAAKKTTAKKTTKAPAAPTPAPAAPAPAPAPAATSAPTTAAPAAGGGDIKIGFINQEGGASGSFPETWVAIDAASKYINEELGGVGGRKLKIVRCTTDGTAASSQKCAQQMVTENVMYVQGGLDVLMSTWYPILDAAKIPVISGIPVAAADFVAPNSYLPYAGGATTYPGIATYILRYLPNAKRVGILANDTGGAATGADQVRKVLEARGIDVVDVRFPASQSDLLAPFAAASRTDAIAVLVSAANCTSIAKARNSQSSTVPMIAVSACFSQPIIDAVGKDGMNGWRVDQKFDDPQGDTPDAVLFQKIVKKYGGDKANLGGFAPPTFSNLMTIYTNVLKPLGAGVTTDAIVAKMKDPAGGKAFMAGRYKCREAGAPYPAICNYQTHWFSIVGGKLEDPTAFVDLTSIIKSIL